MGGGRGALDFDDPTNVLKSSEPGMVADEAGFLPNPVIVITFMGEVGRVAEGAEIVTSSHERLVSCPKVPEEGLYGDRGAGGEEVSPLVALPTQNADGDPLQFVVGFD